MEWIGEHAQTLTLLASLVTLVVWIFYLNLFWMNYRRQLRANLVIGRGAGTGLDSLCIVGNMSAEPVFVEGVIIFAEENGRRWAKAITDFSDLARKNGATDRPEREGPLKSGDYITLGTFRCLVRLADPRRSAADELTIEAIEVWVVADFSSENDLFFARRRFLVGHRGSMVVFRPSGLETRRITRPRERREVERLLQEHLEDAVGPAEPEPRRSRVLTRAGR